MTDRALYNISFKQATTTTVYNTVCTKFILIKRKIPNFIEICSTKFFMFYQYILLIIFMSCFALSGTGKFCGRGGGQKI